MRVITIFLIVLSLCALACSNQTPPTLEEVYEGVWVDESIEMTLEIIHVSGDAFSYDLSAGGDPFLSGSLIGNPDHTVSFAYDDGEQRQISLVGFIDGDILTGKFTHTGLGYSNEPVEMERAD